MAPAARWTTRIKVLLAMLLAATAAITAAAEPCRATRGARVQSLLRQAHHSVAQALQSRVRLQRIVRYVCRGAELPHLPPRRNRLSQLSQAHSSRARSRRPCGPSRPRPATCSRQLQPHPSSTRCSCGGQLPSPSRARARWSAAMTYPREHYSGIRARRPARAGLPVQQELLLLPVLQQLLLLLLLCSRQRETKLIRFGCSSLKVGHTAVFHLPMSWLNALAR
jgi:hypothetical protein